LLAFESFASMFIRVRHVSALLNTLLAFNSKIHCIHQNGLHTLWNLFMLLLKFLKLLRNLGLFLLQLNFIFQSL
jgi:hypothetical protein